MRPARRVHDLLSTDMIVSPVTITLQDPLEVTQEPFGTFSFPAHPKIEHHRSARATVLPEVSLMVFATTIVRLHTYGRFIDLNVGSPASGRRSKEANVARPLSSASGLSAFTQNTTS